MWRTSPDEVQVIVDPHPVEKDSSPAKDGLNFEQSFNEYLNNEVKITKMYEEWSERDPNYFKKIAGPMAGIRCLRQDPFECTMSFICSQNNNIKRIFQLVATIRKTFGDKIECSTPEEYYQFPTLAQMKS